MLGIFFGTRLAEFAIGRVSGGMSFFDRKKKERRFDFLTDFSELDKYMASMMDELTKSFPEPEELARERKGRPIKFGFSIKFDGEGKPVIREFGNVRRTEGKPVLSDRREPLVDVNYSGRDITITAELPGVQEKEIKAKAGKDRIIIDVENKERPYFKEIALERNVEPKSLKSEFKNGILEITIKGK